MRLVLLLRPIILRLFRKKVTKIGISAVLVETSIRSLLFITALIFLQLTLYAQQDELKDFLSKYLKRLDNYLVSGNYFLEIAQKKTDAEIEYLSKDLVKKRLDELEEAKRIFQTPPEPVLSFAIKDQTQKGASEINLIIEKDYIARHIDKSGETKDEPRKKLLKFDLIKKDNRWYIKAEYTECLRCDGTGNCYACKGTGKMNNISCPNCREKKVCDRCQGEKFVKTIPFSTGFFIIPPEEYKFKSDWSTTRDAANSYAQVLLKLDVTGSDIERKYVEGGMKLLSEFYDPEVVKSLTDKFKENLEEGRKRFETWQYNVTSFEEKDQSTAICIITKSDDQRVKKRITLKYDSKKWFVSQIKEGCLTCDDGSCRVCKGSGKSFDLKCGFCKGSGKCPSCKGDGFE